MELNWVCWMLCRTGSLSRWSSRKESENYLIPEMNSRSTGSTSSLYISLVVSIFNSYWKSYALIILTSLGVIDFDPTCLSSSSEQSNLIEANGVIFTVVLVIKILFFYLIDRFFRIRLKKFNRHFINYGNLNRVNWRLLLLLRLRVHSLDICNIW